MPPRIDSFDRKDDIGLLWVENWFCEADEEVDHYAEGGCGAVFSEEEVLRALETEFGWMRHWRTPSPYP